MLTLEKVYIGILANIASGIEWVMWPAIYTTPWLSDTDEQVHISTWVKSSRFQRKVQN